MTVNEIIENVKSICRDGEVSHLYLFGSYARGTNHMGSDIDFVLKGTKNFRDIEESVNQIETLKTIDLFDYDNIKNPYLKEAIERDAKLIY